MKTYVICGSHTWFTFPKRSPFEKGWYGISLNWSGMSHGPQPVELSCIIGAVKCGTSSSPNILSVITLKCTFRNNATLGHHTHHYTTLATDYLFNREITDDRSERWCDGLVRAIPLCFLNWPESTVCSVNVTLLANNFTSCVFGVLVKPFPG